MAGFSDQLVLSRWALRQLGVDSLNRLSVLLRSPELEGWADGGGTYFAEQLAARLPKQRSVSDDMLREYDLNIAGHWKHITRKRNQQGSTLYPLYFQYLGLLLTEIYLDRYFRDRAALLVSLNEFLTSALYQSRAPRKLARGSVARHRKPRVSRRPISTNWPSGWPREAAKRS